MQMAIDWIMMHMCMREVKCVCVCASYFFSHLAVKNLAKTCVYIANQFTPSYNLKCYHSSQTRILETKGIILQHHYKQ